MLKSKKKVVKQKPKFHPEVIEACKKYSKANAGVGKVEGSVELAKWTRAGAAYNVMITANKHNQPYISAAVKVCGVARSIVTMDCKAEQMRQRLKFAPQDLPKDSVSAFYELHRAQEAALFVAGENAEATAAALLKVKNAGKSLANGSLSVRNLRKSFLEEFAKQKAARSLKGADSKRAISDEKKATAKPPVITRMDAEALKVLIDETVVPSGVAVPVITVVPAEPSETGIEAYFADEKFRAAIAGACPAKGALWILVDLNKAEAPSIAVKVSPKTSKKKKVA